MWRTGLGAISSCFPHFSKKEAGSPDFIEVFFEFGCCKPNLGHVFTKIKESVREYFSANHLKG
jgi:hypothetical protein